MTAQRKPEIHAAESEDELVALVLRVRHGDPAWTGFAVQNALRQAALAGVTPGQALTQLPRLAGDPHAVPGDLVPDSRSPVAPKPRRSPEEAARLAARGGELARELMWPREDTP